MKDVRIDQDGNLRCWKCDSKNFNSQRTMRSKVGLGVGALILKPKLKCLQCGKYNDVGNAKAFREAA